MNEKVTACLENLKAKIKNMIPYSNEETGEIHLGIYHGLQDKDTSFAVIAVRCDDKSCTGRKNLDVGEIYQLLDGYDITEETVTVSSWRICQNQLYDDYDADCTNGIPHIQFSAIVGKNGSGKSTIIELIMRLINNFATVIYGEVNREPAADPLRFVENVMGTLWYSMDRYIYKLSVSNNNVVLSQYNPEESESITSDIVYNRGNPNFRKVIQNACHK